VRVEIERATGVLRIAKAYSVLECGQVLVPEVVEGQAQGGFAMGVGYALLETLPPYEDGPGMAGGTSATISSSAAPTCRCTTWRSRCCRPYRRARDPRAWRRS
jgi:xanthine dehydrogenase molybdopterin-binding subunit B